MNLTDLLSRYYDAVGDSVSAPRTFALATTTAYMNDACLFFRAAVREFWFRVDMPVVAAQQTYNLPANALYLQRVSYGDNWLEPVVQLQLTAIDPKWHTLTAAEPLGWTQDGVNHNQFRIYPATTASSAESFTYSAAPTGGGAESDYGMLVRFTDSAGADADFQADTLAGGAWPYTLEDDTGGAAGLHAERGIVISVTDMVLDTDLGEVQQFASSGADLLTLWCVELPPTMADGSATVPLKPAYQIAPLWYALWQTYLEEGEHHNSQLAAYYGGLWAETIQSAKDRAADPLPYRIRAKQSLGQPGYVPRLRMSDTITVDGNPITVTFPWGF